MGKMIRNESFLEDSLHLFVLVNFALAQPLFDLLSRNAEFFVARRSEPVDLLFLISILCVLVPMTLVLLELLVGFMGKGNSRKLHFILVFFLAVLVFLPVFKKYGVIPDNLKVLSAFVVGALFSLAYAKLRPTRTFLTLLLPAILLFPALFLFHSPVYRLVFPAQSNIDATTTIKAPPPIVMVVFDEFPSTALMDEAGNIDEMLYPNFSALSKDAYWFRNATTVADTTHNALPAILTGNYVKLFRLPDSGAYPKNLFSLLGGQYTMKVMEQTTHLCPDRLYRKEGESFIKRTRFLLQDLSIVYLHIIFPVSYSKGLPDISQGWMNFRMKEERHLEGENLARVKSEVQREELEALKNDRIYQFEQFIGSINPGKEPTLYFLHSLLPHSPYYYLPSGKRYSYLTRIEGLHSEKWENDATLVNEAYKRFSLQVGFVDTLVGKLTRHLKKIGMYKESLIIITADHGVSFQPNNYRRALTNSTGKDILPVPLFIKIPNQKKGIIDDGNVESIDILPTIFDILGLTSQWKVDGLPATELSSKARKEKIAYDSAYKRFSFAPDLVKKELGSNPKPFRSNFEVLLGKDISSIGIRRESAYKAQVDQRGLYDNIDLESSFVPAQLKGNVVFRKPDGPGRLDLAVAINGIVRAVTGTFWRRDDRARFSTVVPENSFKRGKNRIEIFNIETGEKGYELVRTGMESETEYSLQSSVGKRDVRIIGRGQVFPVVPNNMRGYLDSVTFLKDTVVLNGWAVDLRKSTAAQSVLVFVDGVLIDMFSCDMDRPDIAKYFANSSLKRVGFKTAVPLSKFGTEADPEVRLFALVEGEAFELRYNKNYPWMHVSEVAENKKKRGDN